MKCVAIDFETANKDSWSACSLGIALRKGGEIVSREWLIQPPSGTFFEPKYHVALHGITSKMVENSPTFPQVWQEVETFIGEPYILVAHNASSAERRILSGLFDYYKMGSFLTPILCTLEISKAIIPDNFLKSRKLPHLLEFLEIEFGTHHNAQSDAIGCLKLAETLSNNHFIAKTIQKYSEHQNSLLSHFCRILQENLAWKEKSTSDQWKKEHISKRCKIEGDEFFENLTPDGRLEGKTFAITGDLEIDDKIIPQKCILDIITILGGNTVESLTHSTHFLIAGNYKKISLWDVFQQWQVTDQPSEKHSLYHLLTGKIKKAIEILQNNPSHNLQIISSNMFLEMLE